MFGQANQMLKYTNKMTTPSPSIGYWVAVGCTVGFMTVMIIGMTLMYFGQESAGTWVILGGLTGAALSFLIMAGIMGFHLIKYGGIMGVNQDLNDVEFQV